MSNTGGYVTLISRRTRSREYQKDHETVTDNIPLDVGRKCRGKVRGNQGKNCIKTLVTKKKPAQAPGKAVRHSKRIKERCQADPISADPISATMQKATHGVGGGMSPSQSSVYGTLPPAVMPVSVGMSPPSTLHSSPTGTAGSTGPINYTSSNTGIAQTGRFSAGDVYPCTQSYEQMNYMQTQFYQQQHQQQQQQQHQQQQQQHQQQPQHHFQNMSFLQQDQSVKIPPLIPPS